MKSPLSLLGITKLLLAGLFLAAAALLTPTAVSAATSDTEYYQSLVASTGCTASVSVTSSTGFNGFYAPAGHYIMLIGMENLPQSWADHIALHEAGHCMQAQDGTLYGPWSGSEREWDADRRAIRWQADRGVDGAEINHEIWAWVYQTYGVEGVRNSPHGTFVDRITRGWLNKLITRIETL